MFQSRWVGTVFILHCNKNTAFKANVKSSQRVNAEPHYPRAVADKDGHVICAHCNCMPGVILNFFSYYLQLTVSKEENTVSPEGVNLI